MGHVYVGPVVVVYTTSDPRDPGKPSLNNDVTENVGDSSKQEIPFKVNSWGYTDN